MSTLCIYTVVFTATAWKKFHFISSESSNFRMIDSLLTAVHTFTRWVLTSLSVDEILLLSSVNLSTNFRSLLLKVKMTCFCLKLINSVLFALLQLWQVYLEEVIDHLCSLHLLEFPQDIICFLLFFNFLFFYIIDLSRFKVCSLADYEQVRC